MSLYNIQNVQLRTVQPYTQADILTRKCVAVTIVADPDPGSGMKKNCSGTGIRIRNNGYGTHFPVAMSQIIFSKSLETVFRAKNTKILSCRSEIFLIRDFGFGMKKFGSATLAVTHQCNSK